MRWFLPTLGALLALNTNLLQADEPLHRRIDALIKNSARDKPFSPSADDGEFLRRAYLDFAGRIPSAAEARKFLDDKSPERRTRLLDELLASPQYPIRMQEAFGLMFMERLGEHPTWVKYLRESFAANKPWDQMAREMLAGSPKDNPGAAFFLSKRLENYGQNPVDYPALARDIGRLFLGKDFRCAQCHDHLFISDYKQVDFQGLFAFVKNVSLLKSDVPAVSEKPTTEKVEFVSVFDADKMETGPRIPGVGEVAIPKFAKGQEYLQAPDKKKQTPGIPKFSTLAALAEKLPVSSNESFNRNAVNRIWFVLMGRGLIHPLDLDHSKNPPSHPEVLDLLAKEFVAHQYDVKWLLRELALTEAYQRSSRLPTGVKDSPPPEFRTALQRRLEPEQLLRAMLEATGEKDVKGGATFDAARTKFLAAFAYPMREPEEEFNPTLQAALFLLNDKTVLAWLQPKAGNLLDRLAKMENATAIEEMYVTVLTRRPTADEARDSNRYLEERKDRRPAALRNLTWSLIASTEFCVNH